MALKPILFNTDMVKAILDGRKTQTRRAVKPQPKEYGRDKFYLMRNELNGKKGLWAGFFKDSDVFYIDGEKHIDARYFKAPYQPGDILWVRETWARGYIDSTDAELCNEEWFEENYKEPDPDSFIDAITTYFYRADFSARDEYELGMKWCPSIHMPREAARIFLRVTDVRVENLQSVRYFDCLHEGVPYNQFEKNIIRDFAKIWDSTVKPEDCALYGWGANPWVWVIAFERISREEAEG